MNTEAALPERTGDAAFLVFGKRLNCNPFVRPVRRLPMLTGSAAFFLVDLLVLTLITNSHQRRRP